MKILIACEESQTVCKAFRELGFEAYSCDLQECSGGHPEWHINADVLEVIKIKWDAAICFPPCTHLAASGAPAWKAKQADGRQQQAIDFVMKLWHSQIDAICIENPTGILSKALRKPDQIIHPYYFGDPFLKRTCLWLKGLPNLKYSLNGGMFDKKTSCTPQFHYTSNSYRGGKRKDGTRKISALPVFKAWDSSKQRSKTFPSIAKAMAEQWGEYLKYKAA